MKKISRRAFLSVMAAAGAAAALTACGGSSGSSTAASGSASVGGSQPGGHKLIAYAWDKNFNIPALNAAAADYKENVDPEFELEVIEQSGGGDIENSEQTYYRHTVDLSISNTEAGDSHDTKHYHEFILTTDTYHETKSHFAWIGEIEDERLLSALEKLSEDDLRLLTLYAYEGYTEVEISKVFNVSQPAIHKRIAKITIFLKKF